MRKHRWGDLAQLRYGKSLAGYPAEPDDQCRYRVYGTNGPIGWHSEPLTDRSGIIIGRKGAYRGVHFCEEPFYVIDTAYYLDIHDKDVDVRWAYYQLLTVDINRMDSGSAIPSTRREDFYAVPVCVPSLIVQKKTADILRSYDLAIDNNRRRMALLEESARLLYREWFVRLRFPGHERTKIVDGVPEGWRTVVLEKTCVAEIGIQTGPFGSQLHQSDYSEEGFPVVMPKDIVGSTISTDSIARVPEEICYRLPRHILQEGDIVLARRGDIGRKSLITSREAGWMCGTGCMRLRPDPEIVEPRFLFTTLGREDVMGVIAGRAQGAIMPNLNLGILSDIPIVLPPASLQQQFLELVSPIHRQVEVLQAQAEKLRTARDLLLPRLMSGEMLV